MRYGGLAAALFVLSTSFSLCDPTPSLKAPTMYGTVPDGDTYFSTRLHEHAWSSASGTDKSKALVEATRAINALGFRGVKHSVYALLEADPLATEEEIRAAEESQPDQFPRDESTTVPEAVEFAAYEISHALLDGRDTEAELENLGVTSHGIQSVRVSYDRASVQTEHIANGIPSWQAWRFLLPYIDMTGAVKVKRAD